MSLPESKDTLPASSYNLSPLVVLNTHLLSIAIKNIKFINLSFLLSTYRCDDRDPQFFPVQDELSVVFDLYMLDEFA